jgi:NADH-quinone oxidoreductase subunit G
MTTLNNIRAKIHTLSRTKKPLNLAPQYFRFIHMPQITIDGKAYSYEGQPYLLQFALDHGVEIPYFCYHPAMSIPTNCRMCLVEVGYPATDRATGALKYDEGGQLVVNWGRKPATACNTPLSPNMVVKTHVSSEAVKADQKGVLEYMLINHPLDCPICDEAGECCLQIWTYKYGPQGSRYESAKVHKPKRVELGPNVVLDAERCINCTRCVRFTEEISKTDQLTIIGRGEKNYPSTAPGEVFDDAYSMNTIDICPVGALTSRDFRFKARAWEMAYAPGVCTSCAKGCNIDVWVRDNKVLRLTPRENKEVNQYWMCDAGRLNIQKFNEDRISGARLKGDVPVEMDKAVEKAAELIKKFEGTVHFIGSARASMESNWALRNLARKVAPNHRIFYITHVEKGWGDNLLRRDDRSPNARGCELLGFEPMSLTDLIRRFHENEFKFIYLLEDPEVLKAVAAAKLDHMTIIAHGTHHVPHMDKIDVVLPAAMEIEAESIFINGDGQAQYTKMAKQVSQMSPEMWMRLPKSRLDKAAVAVDVWRSMTHIHDVLPSWRMVSMISRPLGKDLQLKEHKDVVAKLKAEVNELKDLKVDYKVPKEAFKISQYDFAIK